MILISMIKNKKMSILAIFLTLLSACDDNHDLINYINEAKQHTTQHNERDFSMVPIPILHSRQQELSRNPFQATELKNVSSLMQPNHPYHPLEAFSLDKLQFVGLLQQKNTKWALIEDPNRRVIQVMVGDYVGLNNGRLIAIKNNQLIVQEHIKTLGVATVQQKIIYLKNSVRA